MWIIFLSIENIHQIFWNYNGTLLKNPVIKQRELTWYKVKTRPSCSLLPPFSLLSKSQPLLSPSSIERTHIGSVWSPFNGHNLDMRGGSGLQSRLPRKKSETYIGAPAVAAAPGRWCDCKIRRVHVSNNGIPSHYSDDSRWKGNLINSPARCSAVHNVSLNRTPLVGVRGTQINIQMSLVVAERPPSPLIPTYDNLIYEIMWLFMSQWHQWHVWGLPINFLSTT